MSFWKFCLGLSLACSLDLASPTNGRADFTATNKTLYVVATAHLDDQWNWTILDTINTYLPNTLRGNFSLFANYPHYTFSFEESFRYRLAREYYPAEYLTLSNYLASGRWRVAGATVVAGDVIVTSPESLMREMLYAHDFWQQEFSADPVDLFLPDCFGFPYSLPSVAAHCGLKGFSTQKLQVKTPAIPIPFQNIGKWVGADGNYVVAALQPGSYHTTITDNLSTDAAHAANIDSLGAATGLFVDYMYFGLGDTGGAPDGNSVNWLEQSVTNHGGLIHVVSAGSDQLFRDLSPADVGKLPVYAGELLMRYHGAGCYTAHSEMKRYHRLNEQRAHAAERAAVMADWLLGGGSYPQAQLNSSWERFLWHTFHDDLPGTSIDAAYAFSWNDELLALNQFSSIESHAVGEVAQALDTTAQGMPLVVYNPLGTPRDDIVETAVTFTNGAPAAVRVYDAAGNEVPAQTGAATGNSLPVIFLAHTPSLGAAVYDVRPSGAPSTLATGLSISPSQLENARYRVQLNGSGDVTSVFDKLNQRELLRAPIRWQAMYDQSTSYPVWEILYSAVTGTPSYLGGKPVFKIVENGPARVCLEVTRFNGSSTFTERIRLAAGDAGDRVEWNVSANWGTRQTLLKVQFPLAVTNPAATYDLGLGVVQRTNNTANQYEVPAQKWADLTDLDGRYGATIVTDCKYGWDKPDSSTLRLTIFHTPDPGNSSYGSYQKNNDLGCHEFSFALMGHTGDWRNGSAWTAERLDLPLQAFQTPPHSGPLGALFSFLSLNNSNVMVKAVKQAEHSNEIIVRLQELAGSPQIVQLTCAGAIAAAREVNGVESPLGILTPTDGTLTVSLGAFRPMTLALTLAPQPVVARPASVPVSLPFNMDAVSSDANRQDGNFDRGFTYPAELLPSSVSCDGVDFQLGPATDGAANAVACQGQVIPLPAGYDRLCFLAAAATNDLTGAFTLGGYRTNLMVCYYSGFIGQWNPPSLKRDEVAWVCTHRHSAGGTNDAYRFCYLFKYSVPIPAGAASVILPNVPGIRIFALSAATNTAAETAVAGGPLAAENRPWASAGTNQSVSAGAGGTATVTLDATASQAERTVVSYRWEENGVAVATGSQPTLTLPVGAHTIVLTVTDDRGVTATDAVLVTVLSNAGNGVWINPSSGNWMNADNWTGGDIACGPGNTANFATLALPADNTVTLDTSWTIGNLLFDDLSATQHQWTVTSSAANTVTLDGGGVVPLISAAAPTVLNVSLAGASGFTKAGPASLSMLGANSFSGGSVQVNGGALALVGNASLAVNNNFNVSNGVVNLATTGQLGVGNYAELGGLYNTSGSAGSGVINQTAGMANIGGGGTYLEIGGTGAAAFGAYNLAGGNLNIVNSSGMRIGASGLGLFTQTGGTLDCARYLAIGSATGGSGTGGGRGIATFLGGTASLGSANYRVILGDKTSSVAVLNIGSEAGGNALVTAASTSSGNWGIELLDVAGVSMSAVLNLNSGVLQTVGPIWRNTANNNTGTAVLNFNGGTLQAGAGQANFISNALTAVKIYRGGAAIDTQAFAVTNSAPLIAAAGQGIYPLGGTIAVSAGGAGYSSAPWVTVGGGTGSNAMAVATLIGGSVAAVAVTCPGEGYQAGDVLSFTFSGGGSANPAPVFAYALQPGDVAPNGSGTFTKLGSGSLTLAGTNTFGGDVVISNGNLNIAGRLGLGAVAVNQGSLTGNGMILGPVTVGNGLLSPGTTGIGTLTISNNLTFSPGAACLLKLDKSVGTNDVVRGVKNLGLDGTLILTNLAGTLAAADAFRLFSADSTTGNFKAILPPAPGSGLAWNTGQLQSRGIVSVVAVNTNVAKLAASLTNGSVNLSWPADHTGWRLQTQTNKLTTGLSTNWLSIEDARNTNAQTIVLNDSPGCVYFRLIYP